MAQRDAELPIGEANTTGEAKMSIPRAIVALLILAWFILASVLLFVPLLTAPRNVPDCRKLTCPPEAPGFPATGSTRLTSDELQRYTAEVNAYAKAAEAYGKYQDAYGKYAANAKAGTSERLSPADLGKLVGTLLSALVAWAFVSAGAQVLNNAQLIRAGQPPQAIRLL